MKLTKYCSATKLNDFPELTVLLTFLEQGMMILPTSKIDKLFSGELNVLTEYEQKKLQEIGALIPDSLDEVSKIAYYYSKIPYSNSIGKLTVLTTYDCNLKCYYCLQNPLTLIHTFDNQYDSFLVWLLRWITDNCLSEVNIEFIGGEPLLNVDCIRKVCSTVIKTGVKFKASLITNGLLLTDEIIKELAILGLRSVQLTFDGPKELHDKVKFCSEFSCYDHNKELIKKLKDRNIKVDIRINFLKGDYATAIATAKSLVDIEEKRDITMYFSEIFGLDTSSCAYNYESEVEIKKKSELLKLVKSLGFSVPYPLGSILCKAESDVNFVITPNLDIYKCYLLVGNESQKIGSIVDGRLDVMNFSPLIRTLRTECEECYLLPICKGGCRANNILNSTTNQRALCGKSIIETVLAEFLPTFYESNFSAQIKKFYENLAK